MAYDECLHDVVVVYCDTGWAAPDWDRRVSEGESFAISCGFDVVRLKSMGMKELVRMKKGWPGNAQQFCTMHLKGVPFLEWIDAHGPDRESVVIVGKRRAESRGRANTLGYISESTCHGGRLLWHPLFLHTDDQRNELVERSGMKLLPYRSQECSPCVNANRGDFLLLTPEQIEKVNDLEVDIGKPMYRPKRFGAVGIYGVMVWAKYGCKSKRDGFLADEILGDEGCGSPFGCGL